MIKIKENKTIVTCNFAPEFAAEDEIAKGVSARIHTTPNEYIYRENEIEITIKKDGAIILLELHAGDHRVYLYPEQAQHLKRIMEAKTWPRKKGK